MDCGICLQTFCGPGIQQRPVPRLQSAAVQQTSGVSNAGTDCGGRGFIVPFKPLSGGKRLLLGLWAVLIPSGEELGTFPSNPHSAGLCRRLALLPVPTVVTQAITRTLPAASNVTNTPKFSSHLSLHRRPSQPHTDPQTAPALSDFLRSPTAHQKSLEPVHRTSSRTL